MKWFISRPPFEWMSSCGQEKLRDEEIKHKPTYTLRANSHGSQVPSFNSFEFNLCNLNR